MLTEQEYEVVRNCKANYFTAYLQCAELERHNIKKNISRGRFPEKENLTKLTKDMGMYAVIFDGIYFYRLSKGLNPLKVEQECWTLLSPRVENHLVGFNGYIESYDPKNAKQDELQPHLDLSRDLLKKWNVISNSYRAKYHKDWEIVKQEEDKVRSLTALLSSPKIA